VSRLTWLSRSRASDSGVYCSRALHRAREAHQPEDTAVAFDSSPLPGRTPSRNVVDPLGREVLKIEALALSAGQTVSLVFEHVRSEWRQGVWLATAGILRAGEIAADQLVLWTDTAPPEVTITCEATDGLLRFYNVWDSGRGRHRESQSATSGMAVETLDAGERRYACNDIGNDPDFQTLVFRLAIR
jgi:hypothetical protein